MLYGICFLTILFSVFAFWGPCWVPQGGSTPLHISAKKGRKEVVEVLLRNGAEVNATDKVNVAEWRALTSVTVFQHIGKEM